MRNKVFGTAVRLARNLCLSQSRPLSIVWGLVAAPASAGQSCILALDARRPGCTVSAGQQGGNSSDQAERIRRDGIFECCISFSWTAVSPVMFQSVV
jgi:hypothetical protein